MTVVSFLNRNCPESASKKGWLAFQLGLFFLPSSAFIAALFLLKACFDGSFQKGCKYLDDPWNYPFLGAAFLMIIGCVGSYSGWLSWVGLLNWLPFFWLFWAFQPYLRTSSSRRSSALCLLSGSIPVVITGIGQIFFSWEGPWQLFNGLIIWFISPGGEPNGRLSGLFDYANIAGAWLSIIWPISLAALLQSKLKYSERFILLFLSISIVSALILTDSRNAWGALVLAIPFVLGPFSWFWLLPLLALCLVPIVFSIVPWFGLDINLWFRTFVPEAIWSRLSDVRYMGQRALVSTRINQWGVAINLLLEKPWLGWGAAAFSILYPLRTGLWLGHAHNLPLELGVSHGIPASLLIIIPIITLLITALKKGVLTSEKKEDNYLKLNIFDRAWWTSSFILLVLHASDIPFFDSRLNIAGWVLLAGLRCLIKSNKKNSIQNSF